MTRTYRFHKAGGPEVLQIDNIDIPAPGMGEVQFDVKAIGLNRAEVMFRLGKYLVQPQFPSKIGYEASGIVTAVGQGVKDIKPGDKISVSPIPDMAKYGVYGEKVVVPAYSVIKNPSTLSFEEGAAAWMQYLTAYGALFDIADMKKEDYVIITAASSSVGLAAIQLCNLVGATPIATTRTSEKVNALKEAGAKHVITQADNLPKKVMEITKGKGARIAFDPIGGKGVLALAEALAEKGILFQYGALSSEPTPFPLFTALSKSLTMRGYVLFDVIANPEKYEKAKKLIIEGLSSGKLKPIIAKTFKFDEMREAHRYLESNQQFGKIVVTV
ncbi:MAG: zinc-dependent alcohol dehydrogenase family protein [Parachlamydiaceae bacterium]